MRRALYTLAAVATLASCTPQGGSSEQNTIQTILTRSSVREYTDQAIEPEQVELMLRAAMSAPTAVNKQPWQFIVVTDAEVLAQLRKIQPRVTSTLAIVPCGDMSLAFDKVPDYWIQDLSAATQNLLLAAHSLGLGAVWTGVYPTTDKVERVREVLQLPPHITPLCIVPIGYPTGEPTIKDKWRPEKVHYNQW